jgi:hypothetical protein
MARLTARSPPTSSPIVKNRMILVSITVVKTDRKSTSPNQSQST